MKKYLPLLLIAVVIIALNISEKNQPQNNLLISGIAVEPGEEAEFKFTFSIMEGEEDDLIYSFRSCEGRSVEQAAKKISETEGKEGILSLCRWLIISTDIETSAQKEILQTFIDNRGISPKLLVFEGDAEVINYIIVNQIDTQKLIALPEKPQSLPDYVNDGKITNFLVIAPEGLKTVAK